MPGTTFSPENPVERGLEGAWVEDLFALRKEQKWLGPPTQFAVPASHPIKSPLSGNSTPHCAHPRDAVTPRSSMTGDFVF